MKLIPLHLRNFFFSKSKRTVILIVFALSAVLSVLVARTPVAQHQTPPSPAGAIATCATPPAGMVSWWPAENNTHDIVSHNNGTLENGAGFAGGEVGQAFSFNGSNQDVFIGDPANLKLTTGITIDAWDNPTSSPGGLAGVLTKWTKDFALDSTADSYGLYINNAGGTIQVQSYIHLSNGGESGIGGGSIPLNAWSHIAVTYDAASGFFAVYLNGVEVNSGTGSPLNIFATDASVRLSVRSFADVGVVGSEQERHSECRYRQRSSSLHSTPRFPPSDRTVRARVNRTNTSQLKGWNCRSASHYLRRWRGSGRGGRVVPVRRSARWTLGGCENSS